MAKNTSVLYVIVLIALAFFIGINFQETKLTIYDLLHNPSAQEIIDSNSSDSYIINDCKGLELKQTAFCLRNELSPLINYTVRNENQYRGDDGSFEDVLKNGGDCSDYNGFYAKWAKQLGFFSLEIILPYPKDINTHLYTTIYDKTGYCVMDQSATPDCHEFILPN